MKSARFRKLIRPRIIIPAIIVGILLYLLYFLISFCSGKPLITITEEDFDKISRPENYDPNENALALYKEINDAFENMPDNIKQIRLYEQEPNEAEIKAVSEWIEKVEEQLKIAEQATMKPYVYVKMSDIENRRILVNNFNIGRTFLNRSWLNFKKGNTISSCNDLITSHKIGCQSINTKWHFSQSLGYLLRKYSTNSAFQTLKANAENPNVLRIFDDYFQQFLTDGKPVFNFELDRLISLKDIQEIYTDNGKGNGHQIPLRPAGIHSTKTLSLQSILDYFKNVGEAMAAPSKKEAIATVEYGYDYLSTLSRQTPFESHNTSEPYESVQEKMHKAGIATGYLLWEIKTHAINQINHNHQVRMKENALCLILKILKYKIEKGKFPENLEQLTEEDYLKELPRDPYSDKIFIYRKTNDSFTLYSLGPDFDDDGGTTEYDYIVENGDFIFWPVKD